VANNDPYPHPVHAALGPLKPLTWMIVIALVLMVVAVGLLSFKGTGAGQKTFIPGPKEALVYGQDFVVEQWTGVKPSGDGYDWKDYEPIHVIRVDINSGREFKDDFTLHFPTPTDGPDWIAQGEFGGRLRVVEWQKDERVWTTRNATWVGRPDALMTTTARQPGTYALVHLKDGVEEKTKDDSKTDSKDPGKTGSESTTGGKDDPPKSPLRDTRSAPVFKRVDGKWVEIEGFWITAMPGVDPVSVGDACRVVMTGPLPRDILRKGQTVYWYLSEEDAAEELPYSFVQLLEAETLALDIPTDSPGSYVVVFRIVDHGGDDPGASVCEGRIPVRVAKKP
jgi:hypothetical protein